MVDSGCWRPTFCILLGVDLAVLGYITCYLVCVCVCVCVRAPRSGDLRIVPWSIRDAGGPLFAFFLG